MHELQEFMKSRLKNPCYAFVVIIFLVISLSFPGIKSPSAGNTPEKNLESRIDKLLTAEHIKDEIIIKFKEDIIVNNAAMENASAIVHSRTGAAVKKKFRKTI